MIFQRRKQKRKLIKDSEVKLSTWKWSRNATVLDISGDGMRIDIEETTDLYGEVALDMLCEDGSQLSMSANIIWFVEKTAPQKGAILGLKFL